MDAATTQSARQVMGNAQVLLDQLVQQLPVAGSHEFAGTGATFSFDRSGFMSEDETEMLSSVRVYHPRYTAQESQRSFRSEVQALYKQSACDLQTIWAEMGHWYHSFAVPYRKQLAARLREVMPRHVEQQRSTPVVQLPKPHRPFSVPITAYRSTARIAIRYTLRRRCDTLRMPEDEASCVYAPIAAPAAVNERSHGSSIFVYVHAVRLIASRLAGSAPSRTQLTPSESADIIEADTHSNVAQQYQG